MKKTGALLIGSALGLAAGQTMASGFAVSYQSVSAMGTAYAGAGVLSENASNQWYNPATLAGLKKTELSVAVHQVWVDTHFEADNDGALQGFPLPPALAAQTGVGAGDFEEPLGHILVVDDEEINRDLLRRRLERNGYSVEAVEDGSKALERVQESHFDMVLLDIMKIHTLQTEQKKL